MGNEIKDIQTTKTAADILGTDFIEGQIAAGGFLSSFKITKEELLKVATQAEVNTGSNDVLIIPPLKLKNRDGDVATLVDGASVDITSDKCTLATSAATRTFTISHTGDKITIIITLSALSSLHTYPAAALCVSEGVASGDNTCPLAGVSGDKYFVSIEKVGSSYFVFCKNVGQ